MAAYPRKQTIFIFLACAAAIGGTYFYVHGGNDAINTIDEGGNSAAAVVSAQATSTPIVTNTDWRKQFLENPTSGSYKAAPTNTVPAKQEPLTSTDLLGMNFLSKYAQLKQAGLTEDPATVAKLMDQVVAQSASSLPSPKIYSGKDLKTSLNDAQSIARYKATLKNISDEYQSSPDEASVAIEAFETSNMKVLSKIDPIITQYRTFISELLSTPVPASFVENHVTLLNAMSTLLYGAESFRHMDTNPLQGYAAISMSAIGNREASVAFSKI